MKRIILEKIIDLPDTIIISKNKYGYCLIASKFIKKDTIIWCEDGLMIPLDDNEYIFKIRDKQGIEEYIISKMNTVEYSDHRKLYTYSGFINHSCDPNSYSSESEPYQIASKDIEIGEEITCNYLCFDYTCDGHQFNCLCKSEICFKKINGFINLKLEDKIKLMNDQKISDTILHRWLNEYPNIKIIDDLKIPNNIKIINDNNNYKLLLTREIKKDEIIYKNDFLKITNDTIIIIKLFDQYKLLDIFSHTINRITYRKFVYFDSFMDHSCNPNTYTIYDEDNNNYIAIAKKNININEELTCNYESFDIYNDHDGFICQCKSSNCKKIIK